MSKAANTRHVILKKAFELIYAKGYQATSIDEIIATTRMTKGAFFYHFKSKDDMGLAIISEIVKPAMEETYINPLRSSANPARDIYKLIENLLFHNSFLKLEYGCPAANLTQEMTPWNTDFSEALSALTERWQSTLAGVIEKGKKSGLIRKNTNGKQVACFVMSGYWGVRNFGKVSNSDGCYHTFLKELKRYLNSLE